MKLEVVILLAASCCVASADRLVTIPNGSKIPYRSVKLEYQSVPGSPFESRTYLGLGLTKAVDAEIVWLQGSGSNLQRERALTANFTYNLVAPITNYGPGISFGVRDVLNRTPERRAFFVATTYRFGVDDDRPVEAPGEVTLGAGTPGLRGIFLGLLLPWTDWFKLLFEHDSRRLIGGIEVKPMRWLSLRALVREDRPMYTVSANLRF